MNSKFFLRWIALTILWSVTLLTIFQSAPLAASGPAIHITHTRDWYQQRRISPNIPTAGNLIYNGGTVMHTLTAYTIFWIPSGYFVAPGYANLNNRYFNDIGGSGFYNIVTQYYDNPNGAIQNNSTLGGTWVDSTNPYPHAGTTLDPLLDSDIQNEVQRAINVNGWTPSATSMYFVFTAYGIESCAGISCSPGFNSSSIYCAYHGSFFANNTNVIYANMPYATTWGTSCNDRTVSPNNNLDADAEISLGAHEQFEAVTDPLINAWYDNSGAEIGDKCAYIYGATTGNGSNLILNGHLYIVQQMWSNAIGGCASSYGTPSNDDLANATIIAPPYSTSEDTTNATTAADDPLFPCTITPITGYASVWFAFTPNTPGILNANTGGSNYDTILGVWRGTRGSLTNLACNDDISPGNVTTSQIPPTMLQAGITYYLEVAGYTSGGTHMQLSVDFTPQTTFPVYLPLVIR